MDGVIISTKNTNSGYRQMFISIAVMSCLLGVAIVIGGLFLMSQSDESSLIILPIIGAAVISEGIISGIIRNKFSQSYVECYSDKMVGQGIRGLDVLMFNLEFDEITNVSVDGINIYIQTKSGKYQVISDKETAVQVFNYYYENSNKNCAR